MTTIDTADLERLAASITPGPWNSSIHGTQVLTGDSWNTICEIRVRKDFSAAQWEDGRGSSDPTANARAIALVPALIREVLAHRKAEAGMRALRWAGCGLAFSEPADTRTEYHRSDLSASEQQVWALDPRIYRLNAEALAEIKATVDGESDQDVGHIIYGLLDEIAALTPAPQPDTCWRCGGTGLALNYAGEPGLCSTCKGDTVTAPTTQEAVPSALRYVPTVTTDNCRTPTAQEAVAWRCKGYADGWILYGNKAQAELYQACTGCLMEALYAHPPQPSETVAEAQIDAIAVALSKRIYKQTEGEWQPSIRQADELARAALRALKGGE